MSKKDQTDYYAELLLERKEFAPSQDQIIEAIVIAKSNRGLFLDINKCFEGYINQSEIGNKSIDDFNLGDKIEAYVISDKTNLDGVFKLSLKQIEESKNWAILEQSKDQNLELNIVKVLASGLEVQIELTKQIAFVPFRYLDSRYPSLKDIEREKWVGLKIPGRIYELDKSRNKIILNNRVISDEQKEAKKDELLSTLSVGQEVSGKIVRLSDFGVFIDIGGIDALVPASELSWRRFKKPEEIHNLGDTIKAKIFRIDVENKKLAASVKELNPDPWTALPESICLGASVNAKVITQADFGVFLEVYPGVEALLHKSNLPEARELPKIGEELEVKIINIEASKRRMGLSLSIKDDVSLESVSAETEIEAERDEEVEEDNAERIETKEFEHAN